MAAVAAAAAVTASSVGAAAPAGLAVMTLDEKSAAIQPSWTVAVAVRYAIDSDPDAMKRVSRVTGSAATHVEIIARYPCNGVLCSWCQKGAPKPPAGKHVHNVLFTVRNTEEESGVLVKYHNPKLARGGKWVIYAIETSHDKQNELLAFCEGMKGAPYKSECSVLCSGCCMGCFGGCCAPASMYEMEGLERLQPVSTGVPVHCSGYVAAALIYARLLVETRVDAINPAYVTPGQVVDAMLRRPTSFVKQDSVPEELLLSQEKTAAAAAAATASRA